MTAPSLLGMEWTSWRHFARSIFFHSSRITSFRDWMMDGEWCSTCLFRIPHRCSIGFRSGDILGHWITFTLFFFRNPTMALDVCLGSLSCWTIEDWKNVAWSDESRFLLQHSDGRVRICKKRVKNMKAWIYAALSQRFRLLLVVVV